MFDPSSYATLGHIWSQDISNYQKLVEEYKQLVQIYQTDMQTYQMAVAMAQMISQPQRLGMLSTAMSIWNNYSENRYGETLTWPSVMNGQPSLAKGAWTGSTVALGANPDLASQTLGSRLPLANLASVEAIDGASVKCLQVLSQYRQNQQLNQTLIALLKAAGLDVSGAMNGIVGQLNLANSGKQQLRAEQQAQGAIQACLAEETMLQNKRQRDIDAENLNFTGQVLQAYYATENDTWTDGADALQSFCLP